MIDSELVIDLIVVFFFCLLIIIDMLKGFTDIGNLKSRYISNIALDIRGYSNRFSNIIAINDNHGNSDCEFNLYPAHCIDGTKESELCDELIDLDFDYILYKNSTNGFFSYNFSNVFNDYIENNFNFIVTGCCTDICILQFCLTFKAYLNHINKNLDIIVPVNLVETYDDINHPRDELAKFSLYFMKNMGIRLINTHI